MTPLPLEEHMSPATTDSPLADPLDLISPRMFTRLTYRITADDGVDFRTAERIVEQTLAFLVACAHNPGAGLAPSADVDKGWHVFILHTADYAEFCDRVAGRFIHHLPAEPGEEDDGGAALMATVAAMRAAGLHVDADLWYAAPDCTSDCHQCHAGCHDSPKRMTRLGC
jgi:hypothetical protein